MRSGHAQSAQPVEREELTRDWISSLLSGNSPYGYLHFFVIKCSANEVKSQEIHVTRELKCKQGEYKRTYYS